jgi:hypothetical protein
MDFNGNISESGGGGIPDDIDIINVCAINGTFQNLGVGECNNIKYKLPTDSADDSYKSGVILSQGGTIELLGADAIFEIGYGVGTTSFIRQFTFSDGEYSIQSLLSTLASGLNAILEGDGSTNRITLSINALGFVVFFYTSGNSPFINLSTAGGQGWLKLGLLVATTYPPNTPSQFPNLPVYSDPSNQTRWSGYNFDDTGTVYVGDMTITGALTVNTIISDLEVEDSIITLNKNGLLDTNTSGIVLNGNSNSTFSGLLKNSSSDDFYLFANSATLPTETGWTPEQTGNLYLNGLSSNSVSVGALGVEYILPSARAAAEGYALIAGQGAFGTATEWTPRLVVNSSKGEIQSPDTLNFFQVNNNNLTLRHNTTTRARVNATDTTLLSPNQATTLTVSDSSMVLNDGQDRLISDATETKIASPDGTKFIVLRDTDLDVSWNGLLKQEINGILTYLRGGNTNQTELSLGGGPFGFRAIVDGNTRFQATSLNTNINSSLLTSQLRVNETDISCNVNNFANRQFSATLNDTYIASLNSTNKYIVDNTELTQTHNNITRSKVDAIETVLFSPDTLTSITAQNTEATITKDAQNRVLVDGNTTNLYSPDGQNFTGVANLQAATFFQGTARLRHNSTESRMVSPNQQNNIIITDTETKLQVGLNDRIEANAGAVRIGGAYDIPIVAGAEGQILQVDASGNLAYNSGQVYASLQTGITTAVSLPLQNTYYPLNNGVVGSNSGEFTFGPLGLMTYTGTYPLFVRVAGHLSIERTSMGAAQIFRFTVLKNGTFNPNSGQCRSRFDDANQWPLEVSFESVIGITTGDTLQLAISNEDAVGSAADVYSYSFVVSKI